MVIAAPEREQPRRDGLDERAMLTGWLDYHRATLLAKCAGLSDDQLRQRSVRPSSLSLLGLVRHMAEVERGWFRRTLGGEDARPIHYDDDNPDGDFDDVDDADVSADVATFLRECDAARSLTDDAVTLEQTGSQRHGQSVSLRWILVHMIEEYARHNGHADLIRERIDGTTGE